MHVGRWEDRASVGVSSVGIWLRYPDLWSPTLALSRENPLSVSDRIQNLFGPGRGLVGPNYFGGDAEGMRRRGCSLIFWVANVLLRNKISNFGWNGFSGVVLAAARLNDWAAEKRA